MIRSATNAIACAVLMVCISQAQTSDGTFALPEKVVVGNESCSMTDLPSQFINGRNTTCPNNQSHFANGEIRLVDFGFNYIVGGEDTQNVYELTSCQCSSNGTWTRVMNRVINSNADFIRWLWKFYGRNASCELSLKRDLSIFGCSYPSSSNTCTNCPEGFVAITKDCDICAPLTPIVIDLDGDGLKLTSREGGVAFNLNSNGERQQAPWTEAGARDAWLVLNDRENGWVEDGLQLFGDHSAQGPALSPKEIENGYRALRGFDDNKDKQITPSDGVWRLLALWIDANHNGISDPGEILSLSNAGIASISLEYKESRRRDRYGNEQRYRAEVKLANGKKVSSWDVLLTASN